MVMAASVVVAGAVGCSTPPPALGGSTAHVTINGQNVADAQPVNCSQNGWTWFIETPGKQQGFTAVLRTGDKLTADSVEIRDLGGFTGGFWSGTVGNAEATFTGQSYTISGEAQGYQGTNSTDQASAKFRIEADC
jgi:ipoprotein LpqH